MAFFSPEQIATLSDGVVRLDFLVEFRFASGTKRVWNGNTPLTSGGFTWQPMGGAGSIEGLSMPTGTAAENVTLQVNGLPGKDASLLAEALNGTSDAAQQMVIIYIQLFDADWQVVGSPIGIWWGFMQPPRVSRTAMSDTDGSVQSVSVVAENAFFNRARPPYGRYTDRDQQRRSNGDKFFQFTPSLLFKQFDYPIW